MNNSDLLAVNTLRFLSIDAIQKANSGHPGLPMGAAPMAYTLWKYHMKHNPENPQWLNRDRFVLSAGHGSMLLYSLLHLFGYGVTADDLKGFRSFGSKTPGHPEYRHTPGVETTTGPLGQGIANAVGFAMAESYMAEMFNQPGYALFDHYTYVLAGDGCLMEGISYEACSLAGALGLGKLILLYDSNRITIEGDTVIAFRENVRRRFEAQGWHTLCVEDGNDMEAISKAVQAAKDELTKPTMIEIKTQIGYGSPNKAGSASVHGSPLGADEIQLSREFLQFPHEEFHVPDTVAADMGQFKEKARQAETDWNELCAAYQKEYPEQYKKLADWLSGELPSLEDLNLFDFEGSIATRAASGTILNKLAQKVSNLIGGSADLAPSTLTNMKDRKDFSMEDKSGSNLHFGIREFAMTAIASGMALYGGLRPYISGFFVFSDYMKSGLRMQALMGLPVINIFTHDSIGVGEDGPTHQPVEHLAALRSIPGFTVFRPCDGKETAAGWLYALAQTEGPFAFVLSRQNLPTLEQTGIEAQKGAYILLDAANGAPDLLLMASGSEVSLAVEAYHKLKEKGIQARVISMPSWELFEKQSQEYKDQVIPEKIRKRVAVEAASSFGWHRYTGLDGRIISIDTFGASAPAGQLYEHYGFTVDHIVVVAKECVNSNN